MKDIQYMLAKILGRLKKDWEQGTVLLFFSKNGISIGGGVRIYSNILTPESELIRIGSDVTISNGVTFVTHDNSIIKVLPDATDLFGSITIGNHCFIGSHSILLYGVEIADNVIIAAGSVVTSSVKESNVIVGGNPAKVISTWEKFAHKSRVNAWDLSRIPWEDVLCRLKQGERIVKR